MENFVYRSLLFSLSTLKEDFLGLKSFLEFLTRMFVHSTNVFWTVMKPKDRTQEEYDLILDDIPILKLLSTGKIGVSSEENRSDSIQWLEGNVCSGRKRGVTLPFSFNLG